VRDADTSGFTTVRRQPRAAMTAAIVCGVALATTTVGTTGIPRSARSRR
jgi:hypothetical protein